MSTPSSPDVHRPAHGAHWWRRVAAWTLLALLLVAGVAAAWLLR